MEGTKDEIEIDQITYQKYTFSHENRYYIDNRDNIIKCWISEISTTDVPVVDCFSAGDEKYSLYVSYPLSHFDSFS